MDKQIEPQKTTSPFLNSESIPDNMLKDFFLQAYDPGCRYLKSVDIELPIVVGKFKIGYTFTTARKEALSHFGAFENVVCYNQLAFVMFAKALMTGFFPEITIPMTEFLSYQKSTAYILSIDYARYRRAFVASEEFEGRITIIDHEYKPEKNLIIAHTNFNFDNGKVIGSITCGLKLIKDSAKVA